MNRGGRIRYLLASSNTGEGYRSFLPALIEGLKKVYVLKGAPEVEKTTLIRQIGLELAAKGYDADFFVSPCNTSSLEGVICRQLDFAVIDGDFGYPFVSQNPRITGEMIDLEELCDREKLAERNQEIRELVEEIQRQLRMSTELLKKTNRVKKQIQYLLDAGPDLDAISSLVTRLTKEILEQAPRERHYFGSALSVQGLVNYVDGLSVGCNTRYILDGPADDTKSAVLLAVARRAIARGYNVEFFHDGFDPEKLNMIIVTGLGIAVIDANGLSLTTRPGDIMLDTGEWINSEAERLLVKAVLEEQRRFDELVDEANAALLEAESARKRLGKIYSQAMDFTKVELIKSRIMEEVNRGDCRLCEN